MIPVEQTAMAVTASHLSKRFSRHWAVRELSFEVPEGSFYALIGPNGAGKSTTLKMLAGLVRPGAGQARVLGLSVRDLKAASFHDIGYLAEQQQLPNHLSVASFFRYCRTIHGRRWDRELERHLMDLFELPPDRKLRQLSRGMRTKAMLLSTLAFHPRLLLLDEPFSGLDVAVREDIVQGMLQWVDDTGGTTIFASHDLLEVERLADAVGFIAGGELIFSEPLADLLERHRKVELDATWPLDLPDRLPGTWLRPEVSGQRMQFVHSRYSQSALQEEIRSVFGELPAVKTTHADLHKIFIATQKTRCNDDV